MQWEEGQGRIHRSARDGEVRAHRHLPALAIESRIQLRACGMETYQQYLEQLSKLELQIVEERRLASERILQEIQHCIREFGFTPEDIFSADILRRATKRRVRYFDPVSGATWSGSGRAPDWIRDKDRKQFEISNF
jgi:DNA-binding protein H-NS